MGESGVKAYFRVRAKCEAICVFKTEIFRDVSYSKISLFNTGS